MEHITKGATALASASVGQSPNPTPATRRRSPQTERVPYKVAATHARYAADLLHRAYAEGRVKGASPMRVMMAIHHEVAGFSKTNEMLGVRKLEAITGMARPNIRATLKTLEALGCVIVIRPENEKGKRTGSVMVALPTPPDEWHPSWQADAPEVVEVVTPEQGVGFTLDAGVLDETPLAEVIHIRPVTPPKTHPEHTRGRVHSYAPDGGCIASHPLLERSLEINREKGTDFPKLETQTPTAMRSEYEAALARVREATAQGKPVNPTDAQTVARGEPMTPTAPPTSTPTGKETHAPVAF